MLDIKILKENIEEITLNLKNKNYDFNNSEFLKFDSERKKFILQSEDLKNKKNVLSKEIGIIKSKGGSTTAQKKEVEDINQQLLKVDALLLEAEKKFSNFMLDIPNVLDEKVPIGNSEEDNKVLTYSNNENLSENNSTDTIDHSELGKILKLFDQETASKMSGARFNILYGEFAELHRAIGSFMIDTHIKEHGYKEVNVPLIVNNESLIGTGQLPKFKSDLFELKNKENFFLIPTSEVPLTNIFSNKILEEDDLPIKFTSLSTCFRSEAGSYGKDTKGLIRQHQFDKVELVKFTIPSKSCEELENLVNDSERILGLLELPYRKVLLCSGDTGFSSSITYDLEVWLPSQNRYREISSCSNFKDFQSRRLNIKYKDKSSKKKTFVHTLNGSGLAVGRTLAAIIENYQDNDGNIEIPKVLRPYMRDVEIIKKS
tara:strand:- start:5595 stop:6884 length:1290 start_codon:yes stop_codon:yes gene_type:complete